MSELETNEAEADPAGAQHAARELDVLGDRNGPGAWAEYLFVRGLLGTIGRLPDALQARLLGGAAWLAARLERRHSDAARLFQRQALGCARSEKTGDELVRQAWRHLFRITLDSAAFQRRVPARRLLEHFRVDACEGLDELFAGRRGGLFITPHVGDWEAGSAVLPALTGAPLFVIARPPRNRPLSRHLQELRRARGIHVLPRRGGMEHVRALVRDGAWIAFLPDQRPRGRSVVAPFFGRPARCERSVAALVRRLAVPVVFGACYLTGEPFRYVLRFQRILRPEELSGLSIEEITALVNLELEGLILARPEQYYWLHDRYRGMEAAEAANGGR